ncbi:hypothetical protein AB5V95_00215 [Metamycoplasma spumans]|uniref:hypothetical protein n=1 Tax=Metamycoplasma spumans TaxID=92406 RepID=UPI0034DCD58A
MKKIKKTLVAVSSAASIASLATTAIACQTTKIEIDDNKNNNDFQKAISASVKYIAIGDDYAAGNNHGNNNFVLNYFDKENKNIFGISYASYLANSINLLDDEKTKLESYENYGLSGSNLDQWLYILNSADYQLTDNILRNVAYNKNLMAKNNSTKFSQQFGNFEAGDFNKIIEKIKDSNLITISLGFNDFFDSKSLLDIISVASEKSENKEKVKEKLNNLFANFEFKLEAIESKYNELVQKIRALNENININLIGYTAPFLSLNLILKNEYGNDYLGTAIASLNNLIKNVAFNNKVNYFNFNNENYILANPDKFSVNLLDIYPSDNAYKKLAQDVFMKMALSKDSYNTIVGQRSLDSDINSYQQTILFNTKSTTIKSLVLGLTGQNVDSFEKSYQFETIEENAQTIASQNKKAFNRDFTGQLKAYLNNGLNFSVEELKNFMISVIRIFNIDSGTFKLTTEYISNLFNDQSNIEPLVKIFNVILDSKTINLNINKSNYLINKKIAEESYSNLTSNHVLSLITDIIFNKDVLYNLLSDISNSDILLEENVKALFKEFSKKVIEDFVNSKSYRRSLGIDISDTLNSILDNEQIKLSIKQLFFNLSDKIVENPSYYFSKEERSDLLSKAIKTSKDDVKEVIKQIISWMKNNEQSMNGFIEIISKSISELYEIPEQSHEEVRYFIANLILNLDKLPNQEKLIEFVISTMISSKTSTGSFDLKLFLRSFVNNVVFDKFSNDKNNDLLFSILSFIPEDNIDKKRYENGKTILSTYHVKYENVLNPNNISSILSEEKRSDILRVIKNIVLNKNNLLNESAKKVLTGVTDNLIDATLSDRSLLLQLVNQVANFMITQPAINLIKNNDLSAIIGEQDITKFSQNIVSQLINSVKNENVINGFKKVFKNLIYNGSNYNYESFDKFIISFLKDANNNGVLDLIKPLLQEISSQDTLMFDSIKIGAALLEKDSGVKISLEEQEIISHYFNAVLKNLANTKLYDSFKERLVNTLNNLDETKVTNFSEFSTYLFNNVKEFFNLKNNKKLIIEIIEAATVKNKNGESNFDFSLLIKSLKAIFSKEKIIDYILEKIDIKTLVLNEINAINLDNLDIEDPNSEIKNNLNIILNSAKAFANERWDDFIIVKFKEIISQVLNNETVQSSQSLQEFVSNALLANKETLKSLITELVSNLLTDNEKNITALTDILISFLNQKVSNLNISEENKSGITKVVKRLVEVIKDNNLASGLADSLVINLANYVNKNAFNFANFNFLEALDLNKNLANILTQANIENLIDSLNETEMYSILVLVIKNANVLVNAFVSESSGPVSDNNNETVLSTESQGNNKANNIQTENILNKIDWNIIAKKVWNKLSVEKRSSLISLFIESIKELKSNHNLSSLLSKVLAKEIKKLNDPALNDLLTNQNLELSEFIKAIYNELSTEVIDDQLLNKLAEVLTSINQNFALYNSNSWEEFASNVIKHLDANKGKELLQAAVDKLFDNRLIIDHLVDYLVSYLKLNANTTLSQDEINKLKDYIFKVLSNAKNSQLITGLINAIKQGFANHNGPISSKELANKLLESVKGYFDFANKTLLDNLVDFILVKNVEGNHLYTSGDFIRILKILVGKKTFVEFLVKKINVKKFLNNFISSVKLDEVRFGKPIQDSFNEIISYSTEFINENFDNFVLPLVYELTEKLFDDSTTDNIKNAYEWIGNFIKGNVPLLLNKVNEIFATYLNGEKSEKVKSAIANLLVELMDQDLKNINWPDHGKEQLKSMIKGLITKLPSFNVLDHVVTNLLNILANNINHYGFDYKQYNFNGLINIVEVINTINYDNIVEYIKSLNNEQIKNLVILIMNNSSQFSNIIPDYEDVTSEGADNSSPSENELAEDTSSNKNKQIIVANGQIVININIYLKLFKASFSVLTDQDKEEIKGILPTTIDWLKTDKKVKNFVRHYLNIYVKDLILKANPNATAFANGVVDLLSRTLFETNTASNILNSLVTSLLDLNSEKLNKIQTMNDLLKYLITANKEALKLFVNQALSNLFGDKQLVKDALNFIIEFANKKINISLSSTDQENMVNLLTRIVMKLSDFNVVNSVLDTIIDSIANVNILDEEGHFDQNEFGKRILNALKTIEYDKYLTTENISDLLETILDKTIETVTLENELMAIYRYVVDNLSNFKDAFVNAKSKENIESGAGDTLSSESENSEIVDEANNVERKFLENLEKLIYNTLQALNGSVKADNINGKEALINFLYNVTKDQVLKIDWTQIKQNIFPKERMEWIASKFVNYDEVKQLITSLVNDYVAGEKIQSTNLGDLISKVIYKIKDNLKINLKNFILAAIKDRDVVGAVVDDIMAYLSLENTTQDDKDFLIELVQLLLPEIVKTDYFSRKVLNRSVDWVAKYAKQFDINDATKWLNDAIIKIKSGFSLNDAVLLAQFIGSNKIINGQRLVKLINLLFGKSNLQNSIIYNGLRNINKSGNRTNMTTLNNAVSGAISSAFGGGGSSSGANDDPDNITPGTDYLVLIDTVYKILAEAYNADPMASNNAFKIRAQSEAWKAVYRFNVVLDWIIFEAFGRETKESERDPGRWYNTKISLYAGTRSILWELQEGTNIKAIPGVSSKFAGMQYYFSNSDIRRQFTNYVIADSWKGATYYNENNYTPDAIIYIITSSGYHDSEKSRTKQFKFKVTENGQANEISKAEYILLTIKEGGYSKFMNLNNVQSISGWSGLNRVKLDDF